MMSHHRQLRRRIARETPRPPIVDDLGGALDEINAWGALERWTETRLPAILTYGPTALRGYLPGAWAGVMIWHRPRGYYGYRELGVLGVWALRVDDAVVDVAVGRKRLIYQQPLYNPESYHYRIQREFRTDYGDDGAPPAAFDLRARFDRAGRLALRAAVEAALADWARAVGGLGGG